MEVKKIYTEQEVLEAYRKLNKHGREYITQTLEITLDSYAGPMILFPTWIMADGQPD